MRKSWDYPQVRDATTELTENGISPPSPLSHWRQETICPRKFQHTSCNRETLAQWLVQCNNKDVKQPSCGSFRAAIVTKPKLNISIFNFSIFEQISLKVDTFTFVLSFITKRTFFQENQLWLEICGKTYFTTQFYLLFVVAGFCLFACLTDF